LPTWCREVVIVRLTAKVIPVLQVSWQNIVWLSRNETCFRLTLISEDLRKQSGCYSNRQGVKSDGRSTSWNYTRDEHWESVRGERGGMSRRGAWKSERNGKLHQWLHFKKLDFQSTNTSIFRQKYSCLMLIKLMAIVGFRQLSKKFSFILLAGEGLHFPALATVHATPRLGLLISALTRFSLMVFPGIVITVN
jgi:hypothetical protein